MRPYLRDLIDAELPEITVLDVGAMHDGENCYDPLVEQGLARLIGVEPDPASRAKLQEIAPHNTYLPHFLGDGGPARFYSTRFPGCSSLLEPDPRVIDQFTSIGAGDPGGNFYVNFATDVETKRLDDVEGLPPIDFMKLDIQGGELDVLQHAERVLGQVSVLQIEVEFVPLYVGQPLFSDIDIHLRSLGFHLHKFIDVSGRCFKPIELPNPFAPYSQLLWADAIFVSNLLTPEKRQDDELLKSALILNDLYASHDLVFRLLEELDRRQGGNLGQAYLAGLQRNQPLKGLFMNIKDYL